MWLDKSQDQDNELGKQSQSSNPSIGAGAGDSGTGSGGTTAGNTPSSTPIPNTPQTTQKFATVQDYLKTNQPQAEDLGQKFTSSIDSTYGQQKGDIDSAINKTQDAINSNKVNYDPNLVSQIGSDPSKIANDPNQLANYMKQANASYSGPQSFETSDNYGTAASALNNANQIKGELGTTGGREQLIQDQFGVYGQGNKGLDQALLQSSSAFPKVQEQEKQFGSIQDYLNQQSAGLNSQIAPIQQANADTATKTKQATADAQAAFAKQEQDKLANAPKDVDIYNQYNQYKTTPITAEQFSQYGATPEQIAAYNANIQANQSVNALRGNSPYTPTNLTDYLKLQQGTDQSINSISSPEDFARSNALAKLSGNTPYLDPTQVSQAGTYKAPAISGDFSKAVADSDTKAKDQQILAGLNRTDRFTQNGSDNVGKAKDNAALTLLKRNQDNLTSNQKLLLENLTRAKAADQF